MSVLSGLTNQQANKNILLKTVRYKNWTTMSEKAGNAQRKNSEKPSERQENYCSRSLETQAPSKQYSTLL